MADNSWKNVILNHKTYIDTCAILNVDAFEKFVNNLGDSCCFKNKINIITNVHQELDDFAHGKKRVLKEQARKGLYLIDSCHMFVLNKDYKHKDDNFADPKLLAAIIAEKDKGPQLLITSDHKLAQAAYRMSEFDCAGPNEILVMEINSNGELIVPKYLIKEEKYESTQIINAEKVVVENNAKVENTFYPNEKKPFWKKGCFWAGGLLGSALTALGFAIRKLV